MFFKKYVLQFLTLVYLCGTSHAAELANKNGYLPPYPPTYKYSTLVTSSESFQRTTTPIPTTSPPTRTIHRVYPPPTTTFLIENQYPRTKTATSTEQPASTTRRIHEATPSVPSNTFLPPEKTTYVHEATNEHHHHNHHHVHTPGMPFKFSYAVKDDLYGNDYSHNAISDGEVTNGEYRVLLPDGRTQIVKYIADWKNGYRAHVTFEGKPNYKAQSAKRFSTYKSSNMI